MGLDFTRITSDVLHNIQWKHLQVVILLLKFQKYCFHFAKKQTNSELEPNKVVTLHSS